MIYKIKTVKRLKSLSLFPKRCLHLQLSLANQTLPLHSQEEVISVLLEYNRCLFSQLYETNEKAASMKCTVSVLDIKHNNQCALRD
jgi:hypothetical protein